MLTLGFSPIVTNLLVALFLVVCIILILTVLIQRPQGGGLSGAFGSGGGAGQTAFGTRTGDALTIATVTMFAIYLLFSIALVRLSRPEAMAGSTPAAVPTGLQSEPVEDDAPPPDAETDGGSTATPEPSNADVESEPGTTPEQTAPSEPPSGASELPSPDDG